MSSSIRKYTDQFESVLDRFSPIVKPYLPIIARFLLVATFLEDSLRIISQWDDQLFFFKSHRGFPSFFAEAFLLLNVLTMLVGSFLAIIKKNTELAVSALFSVIVVQAFGYGLAFDARFVVKTLSVVGALLLLLADSFASKRKSFFAGVPSINSNDKSDYLQLGGRILLVFLFIGFLFAGEFSFIRILVCLISLVGCLMVVIGFKAKWSAWMLVAFLSISNVLLNNWWSLHHSHPKRDFLKYDFFQTLSIMGGFLLLTNLGPGEMSYDAQKKEF